MVIRTPNDPDVIGFASPCLKVAFPLGIQDDGDKAENITGENAIDKHPYVPAPDEEAYLCKLAGQMDFTPQELEDARQQHKRIAVSMAKGFTYTEYVISKLVNDSLRFN